MSVLIDPIWPWSHLWSYVMAAGAPTLIALALAGLVAFFVPVLLAFRPRGWTPGRLLQGGTVLLLALLASVALGSWGTSRGLAGGVEGVGLSFLLLVPLALAGLAVWTYLTQPGATPGRMFWPLVLRLAAMLLVLLAVMRPALVLSDPERLRTLLYIAVDASESMTIRDESGSASRWEHLLRTLRKSEPALERLRQEHNVEVKLYRFAAETGDLQLDDPGKADGKRTDIGGMLSYLYEHRDTQRPLRGLLVLSDGADNGARPALAEAARWRGLPCPVHAFASGDPSTGERQRDIAVTAIATDPTVPVKGKMTVKLTVDAPGFENSEVRLRLFLDGQEVKAQNASLPLTERNEVKLECTAPSKPGEVKVTVRVEDPHQEGKPPAGDLIPSNNRIETFVNVSKEGVSVLLVDKPRAWEPQLIYDALTQDARIRVTPVWLRGERPVEGAGDLFGFDNPDRPYDVIILGDVTARQVRAVNPRALSAIEQLVSKGAGFLMIGGLSNFGNGDWRGTEVERLLPVDLSVRGQVSGPVKMVPTEAGLRKYEYVLRLDDAKDARAAWERLPPFPLGMTRLGRSRSGLDTVLAVDPKSGDPVLLTQNYGEGRTMAFAGDSTWCWVRNPAGQEMHTRFWRQMVLWLAHREGDGGSVRVEPDTRRLPVRGELGFRVGVYGQGGGKLAGGTFQVEVTGPNGVKTPVFTAHDGGEDRGTFARTETPGVYEIKVRGKAQDPATNKMVDDEASAHFVVYEEDVEMARRAADHDFLRKLAAAGGGEFHRVEELPAFLDKLPSRPAPGARPRLNLWPDWRSTGRSAFRVFFFLAFVALLTGEWFLRRRWGMV